MKITQSDIDKLNEMFGEEELDSELLPYVSTASFGKMIRHPLVFSVPHLDGLNKRINQFYKYKKKAVKEAADAGNWDQYVFLHERPYRLDALTDVLFTYFVEEPETIWKLVASIWTDSDNICQNFDKWLEIWDLPIEGRLQFVMDDDERAAYDALPEIIPVYRGVTHKAAKDGLSWTTDRDKAVWFSKRFAQMDGRKPYLFEGTVKKSNVMAHFLGRNESEIVVLPGSVDVR